MAVNQPGVEHWAVSIQQWWPKLRPSTQQWLIDNNGDVVPDDIISAIAAVGGPPAGDPWWDDSGEAGGVILPDVAIDWIEETANDDNPT